MVIEDLSIDYANLAKLIKLLGLVKSKNSITLSL
jgi:hypothetical protein